MFNSTTAMVVRIGLLILGIIAILSGVVCLCIAIFGDFGRNDNTRPFYFAGCFISLCHGFVLLFCSLAAEYISRRLGLVEYVEYEEDTYEEA